MADPVAVPVKSGWKTTEMYLAVLLLGGLAWICQQLIALAPTILATPGLPPWVTGVGGIVVIGLGWLAKLVVAEYTDARVTLKLAPPIESAAIEAGKAATKDPGPVINS